MLLYAEAGLERAAQRAGPGHPLQPAQLLVAEIGGQMHVDAEPARRGLGPYSTSTGPSQQNVSKHLGVLLRAGILSKRKQGNFSLYSIADPVVFAICEEVCAVCAASSKSSTSCCKRAADVHRSHIPGAFGGA